MESSMFSLVHIPVANDTFVCGSAIGVETLIREVTVLIQHASVELVYLAFLRDRTNFEFICHGLQKWGDEFVHAHLDLDGSSFQFLCEGGKNCLSLWARGLGHNGTSYVLGGCHDLLVIDDKGCFGFDKSNKRQGN
jgi:hypothetical protein